MIVTLQYYRFTYHGAPVADAEFPRLEAAAARAVAQMTHGRAAEDSIAVLPAPLQNAVKTAVCAQIEYYTVLGASVAVTGDAGGGGWTVGKVHVNGGAGQRSGAEALLCPAAVAALEQTGLLYPGVAAIDAPGPLLPWGWFPC